MIKNFDKLSDTQQERVLEIHENQMSAFGGHSKDRELKEVFTISGKLCVRFNDGDWYHYSLSDGTWF